MAIAIDLYTKRVAQYADTEFLSAAETAPIRDIVAMMSSGRHSAVTIVDDQGRPVGIVTEHDIVHRVAVTCVAEDQPVQDIMTRRVSTISGNEHLFAAVTRMRRLGHRHLPVVDATGQLIALLNRDDTIARAADHVMALIDLFSHEDSIDGLREVKASQADIARQLRDEGIAADEIQSVLTIINRDIYGRAIERGIYEMAAQGPPPVDFCAIIMGSGGRGENNLHPDQDYGFILADYPDEKHNDIDPWFIDLAEKVSATLDQVGLPYCTGHVMATNPLWRKTKSQWCAQVDYWNRNCFRARLLNFDIFFDFQFAWGDESLARELRSHVTEVSKGNEPLLRALYTADRDHGTALRWFGRFKVETGGDHRGKINLKLYGLLPLIEGVRMLALREGVKATGTRQRLAQLHERSVINRDELESLGAAHGHLVDLILHNQATLIARGDKPDNFLDPKLLTGHQKRRLRESFKAIDDLRARINFEFGGEIF
jgi:signal-transduction protein with cAMP-binding, CBS, and nucleotidyltransferase domain